MRFVILTAARIFQLKNEIECLSGSQFQRAEKAQTKRLLQFALFLLLLRFSYSCERRQNRNQTANIVSQSFALRSITSKSGKEKRGRVILKGAF